MKIIDISECHEIIIAENGGLWHWAVHRKGYGRPIYEGLKRSEKDAEKIAKEVYFDEIE